MKVEHVTSITLSVLLLIAMLAQYVLFLLGMVIKLTKGHLAYQANFVKTRSVLSYQYIGLRAFRGRRFRLKKREWEASNQKIQLLMQELLHV